MRKYIVVPSLSLCIGVLALMNASTLSARAGILQTFDFETGDTSQLSSIEKDGPTASITASTVVARRGSYCMRASIATADKRAEGVSTLRGTVGGVNWYGWSIYVPSNYTGDGSDDIVSQFHDWFATQPAWAQDGVAPTCFTMKGGAIGFGLKYQSAPLTPAHAYFNLGSYTLGAWHDIVVNVKWTHLNTGFIKIWINGVLKLDYTGPTFLDYGVGNGPYFKMGDYKGIYNWPGTSPRIFYMDEFRMGDANSSYAEVNPLPLSACESFNYTTGGDINGANGGFGWASGWTVSGGTGSTTVVSSGFSYAGLPAVGNRFQIYDTDGVHQQATRTLSKTFGAVNETYWISFLAKKVNSAREAYINFGGLGFEAVAANWTVKTPTIAYTAIPGSNYASLHLFLVRVDAGTSSDTVRVWVDPVIAAGEPSIGTAAVTLTDTSGFSFNTVNIKHGPWGTSGQCGEWDEIRLGGSFNAVTQGRSPSTSFVMDNADASGVTLSGSWTASTSTPGYYGSDYLHDGNTGTKSVRFTPNLPFSGNYELFARWTSGVNRATNAPVDVVRAGGTDYLAVNQQASGGAWISLGTYSFAGGTGGSVLIHNTGANGYVVVDAVRFTVY